jgi:hypothetical protein
MRGAVVTPLEGAVKSAEAYLAIKLPREKTEKQLLEQGYSKTIVDEAITRVYGPNGHATPQELVEAEKVAAPAADPLPFVPQTLKDQPRWVRWALTPDKDNRLTKVPYQVNWQHASNTDPRTWTTYQNAVKGAIINAEQGVGFVVSNIDDIFGIDLDGCRNPKTGKITEWAERIIDLCGEDCYTEITPSGMGLRLWGRGTLPEGLRKFNLDTAAGFGDKVAVEVYERARYFTVTGNTFYNESDPGDVVAVDADALRKLLHGIRDQHPAKKDEKGATASASVKDGDGGSSSVQVTYAVGTFLKYDKYHVLKFGQPSTDTQFHMTLGGASLTYPSQSEADQALCNVLALVHDCDTEKMDEDFRESALYRQKWERDTYRNPTIARAVKWAEKVKAETPPVVEAPPPPPVPPVQPSAQETADKAAEASQDAEGEFPYGDDEEVSVKIIPPFDDSLVVGAARDLMDAICEGTTIPRQYGAHIAKTVMSSILTTYGVKLEGCDSARSYFIIFGESGTGKGESFRRFQSILNCSQSMKPFMHITDTIDSEAGMRDAFFGIKMDENAPLVYFVDEVLTLGQKAEGRKNPEIIGGIIEMANKTTVGRMKAQKGKQASMKTRQDAWLMLFACAQDGEAFATAFPRKGKQGFADRFIPEYSGKVEAGELPSPNHLMGLKAIQQMVKNAASLAANGITMKMAEGTRAQVDVLWKSQPEAVRKSPRLRQQLTLEAYFSAFSRGSSIVEGEDWERASKWFERQTAIRRVFFSEEIPDQVGVYIQRLRKIHGEMGRNLRKGRPIGEVALSYRDLATQTLAYKDNDLGIFQRA